MTYYILDLSVGGLLTTPLPDTPAFNANPNPDNSEIEGFAIQIVALKRRRDYDRVPCDKF